MKFGKFLFYNILKLLKLIFFVNTFRYFQYQFKCDTAILLIPLLQLQQHERSFISPSERAQITVENYGHAVICTSRDFPLFIFIVLKFSIVRFYNFFFSALFFHSFKLFVFFMVPSILCELLCIFVTVKSSAELPTWFSKDFYSFYCCKRACANVAHFFDVVVVVVDFYLFIFQKFYQRCYKCQQHKRVNECSFAIHFIRQILHKWNVFFLETFLFL